MLQVAVLVHFRWRKRLGKGMIWVKPCTTKHPTTWSFSGIHAIQDYMAGICFAIKTHKNIDEDGRNIAHLGTAHEFERISIFTS